MCRFCHIVPNDVLLKLSKDKSFPDEVRQSLSDTAKLDTELRKVREQARKVTRAAFASTQGFATLTTGDPAINVYDCKNTQVLPGSPIADPATSSDKTAKRTFAVTSDVAKFYRQIFGRSSIDDAGMTLLSSVHYGRRYNNAFWNGFQMTYGDGDGVIFIDFSKGDDVVCHELTHGVTQHTLQLVYTNQPGGLNESLSDVFGSIFRQWRAKQSVAAADWLIGKDIMGPAATARELTCLRDMANPKAKHCLAPQIMHIKEFKKGMDPHESSGVANYAFYKVAMAIGGNSWDKPGKIWYETLTTTGPSPNMTMKKFADATRKVTTRLYPGDTATYSAVDKGWAAVGL